MHVRIHGLEYLNAGVWKYLIFLCIERQEGGVRTLNHRKKTPFLEKNTHIKVKEFCNQQENKKGKKKEGSEQQKK